ncbi:phage protein, partial [Lacticaseibacillus rhamnosus]
KKYLVYKVLGGKQKNKNVAQAYRSAVFQNTITWSIQRRESLSTLSPARFTESEIEHYGLQGCDKEEVTGDGMGC